jgi:uncharacterized protein YndB with AHSA1/START domain
VHSGRLTLRRTFHAPPELVFRAFISAEALKEWWSPEGYDAVEVQVDARVGGRYSVVMRSRAGPDIVHVSGIYQKIRQPRGLVFTHMFEHRGSSAPFTQVGLAGHETLVTVELIAHGETTELILVQEQIPTPDAEQMLQVGWQGIMANLARHLECPEWTRC